jgi:hypothetical protein
VAGQRARPIVGEQPVDDGRVEPGGGRAHPGG